MVVGGGPAGAAAALTLRRYTGHRVVLIERSSYGEPRVGETVSGAVKSLLDYLGVPDGSRGRHLESFGTAAAWGSGAPLARDFIFTGRGHGWHLDRRRFDAALAEAVECLDGTVLRGTSLADASFSDGAWRLRLTGTGEITARQVVDASGRVCALARRAGARRREFDRLVGLVGFVRMSGDRALEHAALVEAVPDGWWYSAPLPDGLAVMAFMTDADTLPSGARAADGFLDLLRAAPLTAERLDGCILNSAPRVRPAGSHVLDRCLGEGWVAAGDAVAAFDPLSSLGIGHALASGIQAARIVAARLKGDEDLASTYAGHVARHVAVYLERRASLYRLERRWPDRPFWSRRHAGSEATGFEPNLAQDRGEPGRGPCGTRRS